MRYAPEFGAFRPPSSPARCHVRKQGAPHIFRYGPALPTGDRGRVKSFAPLGHWVSTQIDDPLFARIL